MALNKGALKQSIYHAFKDQTSKKDDPDAAMQDLAGKIADAVDVFIRQLEIDYTAGLLAPNGPVTGTFQYTLN